MDYNSKTREELIKALLDLQQKYDALIATSEATLNGHKQMEVAFRENDSRLELAMHAANMAWWEMDIITGNIIFEKRKSEMLGYPFERFKHYRDFMDLVHPDDVERAMNAMRGHFSGTLDKYEVEYRILTKSGEYIWFHDIGSIVKRDAEGKPLYVTGLVLNVTKRKKAEEEVILKTEELLKLNVEKDKFFSIIAHDLRGPLGAFLGFTQMMAEDLPSMKQDAIQKITLSMRNSAANVYQLLENLLLWSRMEQGLIPFRPGAVQLNTIIQESLTMVQGPAKKKEIEITFDKSTGLEVFADVHMLQTVARNLVSNAIKFTPKGGKINIRARSADDNFMEISIRDTGIGMNRNLAGQIFLLGGHTGRKGTEGEPTTGLVLIICKEFIEKHGGKIWVESEEDKGSTFYFTLPARAKS